MSTTTETISRPPRAPAASIVLTLAAIIAALVLAPATTASAAEPLPTGTYELSVDGGEVTLTVGADRSVTVSATDGLVVQLAFDELGQALDEFTVRSDETTYEVEIEVADDGTYASTVRADDDAPGADGEVVSTVAQCTPSGLVAQAVGLPNHGTIVSAAASGLVLAVEVTDPLSGETTAIEGDFSSLEGAEAFCAEVAEAVPSIEEVRALLAEERAQVAAERAAVQADREEARETAQRAREAAREAAALAREAEQAAREDEREAAAEQRGSAEAEHAGGAGAKPQDTSEATSSEEDEREATDGDDGTEDAAGDTATDGGTTDGGTDGGTDTGSTDTTTDTTTKGNGGKPTDPGANGKGGGK